MSSDHAANLILASMILKDTAEFANCAPQELTDRQDTTPSAQTYLCACCEVMVKRGISYTAIQEVLKISLSKLHAYRTSYTKWGQRDTLLIVTHNLLMQPSKWKHTHQTK